MAKFFLADIQRGGWWWTEKEIFGSSLEEQRNYLPKYFIMSIESFTHPELITMGRGWTLLNDLNQLGPTFGVESSVMNWRVRVALGENNS